jgi:hypothetical protein
MVEPVKRRAAPATSKAFLRLVRKSGVIEEQQLDVRLGQSPGAEGLATAPETVAEDLIRDGLLTPFQASRLLRGKWRGFHIGKYRLLQPIGSGGMGRVLLCEHKILRRPVALKVLPLSRSQRSSAVLRLRREARAAALLDHPNFVRVYDIDRDGSRPFLVFEYIDGTNLEELVRRHGPLSLPQAVDYIRQAASALQHAHQAGVVHRDIKPANLLLDRQGVVKILDLGLALLCQGPQDPLTTLYDARDVLGTADYLAPEQGANSHQVDIRADIYSLGCTFYFLLSGQGPFPEGTAVQKILWHQVGQPAPIRTLRAAVPKGLAEVFERMMAKHVTERFQTPGAVAEALAPWSLGPVAPPSPADMPDHCPVVRALLQAGPPADGGLAETTAAARHERAGQHRAPRARSRRWVLAAAVILLAGLAATIWWNMPQVRGMLARLGPRVAAARPGQQPAGGQTPPLSPLEAAGHIAEVCTVEMRVRSVGSAGNPPVIFLNSEPDHHNPDNFTVMIGWRGIAQLEKEGITDLKVHFQERVIQANGVVHLHRNRPQIVVNDAEAIRLLKN